MIKVASGMTELLPNDYTLFSQWTENNIFFVTQQKENEVYEIVVNAR